jgi:hypothetical protein
MDELDLTSAEAKTTYKEIEEWVQEHYETFSNDIVDIYSRRLSGLLFFCYSLRKKWLITILSVESSECMFSWEKIERITANKRKVISSGPGTYGDDTAFYHSRND